MSRSEKGCNDTLVTNREPTAHVVLYQPEIPQNTGNIGRTCVAVGAKLWIVRPMGFQIDQRHVRRAGLDYWDRLDLTIVDDWADLLARLRPERIFLLSKSARRSIWDARFERGDTFVFGRETTGLPASILDPLDPGALRLPIGGGVRSLNLATTVGIVLFEQQRQLSLTPT